MRQSVIIPFIDEDHIQQGCQCILLHSQDRKTMLNLIDQEINNLYSYESEIIKMGSKRFELSQDDHEDFIVVVSAKICDKVTAMEMFN